ncbi:MAG TPA: TIGR01777 family oxidoreductase [Acidimicrobiales bacterium]|nr:TIGR01777 family oxidoreductase [Acidimicrobiales bacterium]
MTVLLSGAGGLIGRALADQLAGDGEEVVPLIRPGGSAHPGPSVPWDPEAGTIDRTALDRHGPFRAVVHLAGTGIGAGRWTTGRRTRIRDSRIRSTHLLAEVLPSLDPTPAVLVSASAVGYYGDRGSEVLTDESAPGVGFLADLCREWEAGAVVAEGSLRVVRLRTGIVLAPHGGALAKQLPLFRLGLGGPLGDGRQYTSWITLEDHLSVIRRAIDDNRLTGPVNAVAPTPVTNAELTRALGRALHRPARLPVPRPFLELALGRKMAREMVLASQRALPARLVDLGHRFSQPDIDGALGSLVGR